MCGVHLQQIENFGFDANPISQPAIVYSCLKTLLSFIDKTLWVPQSDTLFWSMIHILYGAAQVTKISWSFAKLWIPNKRVGRASFRLLQSIWLHGAKGCLYYRFCVKHILCVCHICIASSGMCVRKTLKFIFVLCLHMS